jgi:hypothetical protein
MIILDFDQVPQYFISTSLTDNQKDIITIKYHVYKVIDPNEPLLPQFKAISEELIDQGISIGYKAISKYYYESISFFKI